MNPPSKPNNAEPDDRLSALINEFFERRRAGENLGVEQFIAEHAELADELQSLLVGLPLIEKVCGIDSGADSVDPAQSPGQAWPGLSAQIPGYEMIEEIGRGGMGVVYKALQVSTKRVVALKLMLAGPFSSRTARRRFEREVELAARLHHPDIVRVLESGYADGRQYFAMDYVDGIPLDRHLSEARRDLRTTLTLFERIGRAVDYAHHRGVIHRDLKPANVLVDDEGAPHILDFGLAKAIDQAEAEEAITPCDSLPGQVMGTLFYLSPEQAAGAPEEVDARTDVYALGTMLFEMLTGSLPFDVTGRPSRIIQRILETPPLRPSTLGPHVDDEVELIILKALEKDKALRYQSSADLADDIQRYLQGEPILAKRLSGWYFLRKKVGKHRLIARLGVVAVVLGMIGFGVTARQKQHELNRVRQMAIEWQSSLEGGTGNTALGPVKALYQRHPDLPETCLVWAQALYRNKLQYEATLLLERALQRDPSQWALRALLAEIYRIGGDTERADTLQNRAENDAPDTTEAWYLKSFATLDRRRALGFAQESVKCSEKRGPRALAWRRLTHLRLATGDLDGAIDGAQQLIELGQDPVDWIIFKGKVLARGSRFREAIEQYSRAVGIQQERPAAYILRAHAYRHLKQYARAVTDYDRALRLGGDAPVEVWHYYQRATPLWILGRTEEALEDYRRVRRQLGYPFFADARQFLILREQGRQDEAAQVLAAALRDVEDPWLSHVFRCLDGQITPEALVTVAEPDNLRQLSEAFYYAGEVCLQSGRLNEARAWFEKCVATGLEFDPDVILTVPMNEYELAQWRLDALPVPIPTSSPKKH